MSIHGFSLVFSIVLAGGSAFGSDWILRQDSRKLEDVVWTGKRYVGVGSEGVLATSEDGATWESRSGATTEDLTRIAWNGSALVAISSEAIHTSRDGLTWTSRRFPGEALSDLAWTGKEFVVAGAFGEVYISVDAVKWDRVSSGIDGDLDRITWNESLLVVADFDQGGIATTRNRKTWTLLASDAPLFDLQWAGSQFAAIGSNDRLLFSRDLESWSSNDLSAPMELARLVWTGSLILAPSSGKDGECWKWERDSANWSAIHTSISASVASLRVHGDRVYALGEGGLAESLDSGRTWKALRNAKWDNYLDVAWDGTRFHVVGQGSSIDAGTASSMLESVDGLVWREVDRSVSLRSVVNNRIASSASVTVMAGYDSKARSASISAFEAATGREISTSLSAGSFHDVAWTGSLFVAVGANAGILASRDGKAWESVHGGGATTLLGASGGGPTLVAIGMGSETFSSLDGRNWTGRSLGRNDSLIEVVWAGSRYVAIGNFGKILTSPDGVAWEALPRASWRVQSGLVWTGGEIVVADHDGTIHSSSDGLQWSVDTIPGVEIRALVWTGNALVVVGNDAVVATKGELPGKTIGVRKDPARMDGFRMDGRFLIAPAGARRVRLVSLDGKRSMELPVEAGRVELPRLSRGVWIAVESGSSGRAFRFVN